MLILKPFESKCYVCFLFQILRVVFQKEFVFVRIFSLFPNSSFENSVRHVLTVENVSTKIVTKITLTQNFPSKYIFSLPFN